MARGGDREQTSRNGSAASCAGQSCLAASAASVQIRADEDLARRLQAVEEQQHQSQLEADERLARGLAREEASSSGRVDAQRAAEVLGALAPLRDIRRRRLQGSSTGTLIDAVLQQLEDVVAESRGTPSTTPSPAAPTIGTTPTGGGDSAAVLLPARHAEPAPQALPMPQEQAIRAAARTGSVHAILAAAGYRAGSPASIAATSETTPVEVTPAALQARASASASSTAGASFSASVAARAEPASSVRSVSVVAGYHAGSPTPIAATSETTPVEVAPAALQARASASASSTVGASRLASVAARAEPAPAAAGAPSSATAAANSEAPFVAGASRSTSAAADLLADFRARVEARRAVARQNRAERLRALNAALDLHAQTFENLLAGTPAGDAHPVASHSTLGGAQFVDSYSTTSAWSGPEGAQCVICCEDLVEGDAVRTLPCGHVYHRECVDSWLCRSRLCCLCKRPIDSPGSEQ